MTKISQLSDIGGNLAANDEFIIRDISDASTPNKKVTASGFFNVATALGFTGLDTIVAGVTNEAKVQVFASGISGRADTTISGVIPARTTISGYFENASGTVGGTFFPVVTQTDIGTDPNQVPVCGMLGGMAFQSPESVSMGTASVDQATISSAAVTAFSNVPLLTGGGLKFPPTQVASADPNTLDDYEEGTWTPTLRDGLGGTGTLSEAYGKYTKIGRSVFVQVHTTISSTSGLTSNQYLYIGGAPFTCASLNSTNLSSPNFSGVPFSGYAVTTIGNNQTEFSFSKVTSNATATPHLVSDFATGDVIQFSGWYMV